MVEILTPELRSLEAAQAIAEYEAFLRRKACFAPFCGFTIDPAEVNPILKPHQRDIVVWAVAGGRRAIFAAFGLGKSVIQLEIMRMILKYNSGGSALIILPLGVRLEFIRDAAMLGIEVRFIRRTEEIDGDGIYLTNYESVRDGKLDPNLFVAASLDEASCLRSYGSLTYQTFLTLFEHVAYKFVATATPSPNRYKELIHYAGFLGVMDTGLALTRFFQRDSQKANNLTLYPHREDEFWAWLASWACFIQLPSDLGYDDTGYDLPELEIIHHEIPASRIFGNVENNGQSTIMVDSGLGLSEAAGEKRRSLAARVEKMAEIVNDDNPETHWLLWHTLEDERHATEKAIPEAVTVYGTQAATEKGMQEREQAIIDFSDGRIRILASKPEIAGSGCNFQRHCHKAIFLGIDYKANDFMQSIHRLQRFQQPHPVKIHLIYTEAERQIMAVMLRKWERHKAMVIKMTSLLKKYGLGGLPNREMVISRALGVTRSETSGRSFTATNNDAVLEAMRQPDNSVGEIVTSIPFADHYEYVESYNDFGHTDGNDHFWEQMDFLTPQLMRILQPGRVACIHVKDRIQFGNVTGTGYPTVSPFHAEAIFHFKKHRFEYFGMITIETDVVRENNQTYRLGYTEMMKDGTKMGVGCPEYVLLFRKPQTNRLKGYADEPVTKDPFGYPLSRWQIDAAAKWRSSGDRPVTREELLACGPDTLGKVYRKYSLENIYDHEFHLEIGRLLEQANKLPKTFATLTPGSHRPDVWDDVNRMLTLNGSQAAKGREKHVCPLQFDIVDRLIVRYSNEGDLVYDPFSGLFTVVNRAVKLGRRGAGSELGFNYWRDGVDYLKALEMQMGMPTLFDLEEIDRLVFEPTKLTVVSSSSRPKMTAAKMIELLRGLPDDAELHSGSHADGGYVCAYVDDEAIEIPIDYTRAA